MNPKAPPNLLALADQAAAAYRIPPGLLEGLIEVESGWNPSARGVNPGGSIDRGIAQINSQAHPDVTDEQAYNPDFAIPWAARYLSSLYRTCGSWEAALGAYNSGRCGGSPEYQKAVLAAARRYGYGGPASRPEAANVTVQTLVAKGVAAAPSPAVPAGLIALLLVGLGAVVLLSSI